MSRSPQKVFNSFILIILSECLRKWFAVDLDFLKGGGGCMQPLKTTQFCPPFNPEVAGGVQSKVTKMTFLCIFLTKEGATTQPSPWIHHWMPTIYEIKGVGEGGEGSGACAPALSKVGAQVGLCPPTLLGRPSALISLYSHIL